jgi:iron complex outermembrane receptor protein
VFAVATVLAAVALRPAPGRAESGGAPSWPAAPEASPAQRSAEQAKPLPEGAAVGDAALDKPLAFGLNEVVVTASPLLRAPDEQAQPVSVLTGQELLLRQQPTLGETVSTMPGVSSTYFGPGASRPVIRGLGEDRIRVLQNGLGTLDASSASPDHAVSIDPMITDRIEVVRGPATLMYGPQAVGGVVNALNNRIPRGLPPSSIGGTLETRGASVDGSFAGAAMFEGAAGDLAYHLDGFGLTAGDLSIPGFARSAQLRAADPLPPGEKEAKGTLPNSAVSTTGFATGFSYVGDRGYLGVAPSLYRSNYGTVAEPDVTIDLADNRLDLAGALNQPFPYFTLLKGKVGLVDYHHTEFEGPEPGTVFKNQGYEGRLEAVHERIGPAEGAVGLQSYRSDFSALGEEAFLPPTLTQAQSGFFFEELAFDPLTVQIGGRLDYTTVDASAAEGFGPARSKSFVTGSGSGGVVYSLAEGQSLALSVAYTQRPPTATELFADGPHVATNAFEIGDTGLGMERSLGFDVTYRRTAGPFVGSIGGFYNRFWNFITLLPTGEEEDDLPVYAFVGLPAHFAGGESELAYRVVDAASDRLSVEGRIDYVWADDRDSGEPLPRIPPLRFGASVIWEHEAFSTQFNVLRAQSQHRVAENELTTDGYTMVNLAFSYLFDAIGPVQPLLFLRLSNLADVTARDSVSFLKDIAPLPGRSVSGGLRLTL